MATTGIWKIEKRLDHVIDYTTNVEKTLNSNYGNESYKDLHNVLDYIEANYKTEKQFYVSGINCSSDTAMEDMVFTKKRFNKTDGILGFHAFQSFKEGEVTPELAHKIGVKLAEEMWGDRFEVVVSTHLNTNHYHNHFVINSVSFKDGKRYYDKRSTYAELRHLSDSICKEYGLSVLEEKACKNSKINYSNYYNGFIQKDNYYSTSKNDIDRAIGMAYSYADFEKLMIAMNYEIIYRSGKLSIRREPYKKNIRIERCFGEDYSIARIKERILSEQSTRIPFVEALNDRKKYSRPRQFNQHKYKGIYGLYLYYCYLLKVFPKKNPYYKLPTSIRLDVEKMDEISKEVRLLIKNNLQTDDQFFSFKNEKNNQLDILLDKRSKLWYKYKKLNDFDNQKDILKEITDIGEKVKFVREEVRLCDAIEDRVLKMKQNLQELKNQDRKDVEKNEYFK